MSTTTDVFSIVDGRFQNGVPRCPGPTLNALAFFFLFLCGSQTKVALSKACLQCRSTNSMAKIVGMLSFGLDVLLFYVKHSPVNYMKENFDLRSSMTIKVVCISSRW